jgi:hypothetical protein
MPGHALKKAGFIVGTGAVATVASIDIGGIGVANEAQAGLLFIGSMFSASGGNLQRCQIWNVLCQVEDGTPVVTAQLVDDHDPGTAGAAFTFAISGDLLLAQINIAAAWGVSGIFIGSAIEHAVSGS